MSSHLGCRPRVPGGVVSVWFSQILPMELMCRRTSADMANEVISRALFGLTVSRVEAVDSNCIVGEEGTHEGVASCIGAGPAWGRPCVNICQGRNCYCLIFCVRDGCIQLPGVSHGFLGKRNHRCYGDKRRIGLCNHLHTAHTVQRRCPHCHSYRGQCIHQESSRSRE